MQIITQVNVFLSPAFLIFQLIVVMASHCYLVGSSGELFIEYLIRNCALTEQNQSDLDSIPNKRIEVHFPIVSVLNC
jgi:hypothetical protein